MYVLCFRAHVSKILDLVRQSHEKPTVRLVRPLPLKVTGWGATGTVAGVANATG